MEDKKDHKDVEKKETKSPKLIISILAVLLVVSIASSIYLYASRPSPEDHTEFFNDYIIAVNDYHTASSFHDLAGANLDTVNWYTQTEDYYQDTAINYITTGKDQSGDCKELLLHAENKLNNLKDNAPNEFYNTEINNRIEQAKILSELCDQTLQLLEYTRLQLEEINYGSETEAIRYYNLYGDLIPEFNENLKNLSDISQEIDLAWDQDWYVLFEDVDEN